MWSFDLQLFGGGANSQQQNADQYYQEQANAANQMLQNFNTYAVPLMQQLDPMLLQTLMGGDSKLMQAAQAPVLANTAQELNTLRSNPTGAVNSNALYQDMQMTGNKNAALAGDQTLGMSLAALQNILGMNFGAQQAGMGGLGSAGSGEANLGATLNQQGNEWWKSILGAAGTAAGAYYGGGFGGGGGGGFSPSANSAVMAAASQPVPLAPMNSDYSFLMPNGTSSVASSPISSGS